MKWLDKKRELTRKRPQLFLFINKKTRLESIKLQSGYETDLNPQKAIK